MNKVTIMAVAAFAVFALILQSAFVVRQTEQALVLRFGEIKRVIQEPGLSFKVPFVDSVAYFDNRLLDFNANPQEFITKDREADVEERVVIDAFVQYRIVNPVRFYQVVRNEAGLEATLDKIVEASLRRNIAGYSLNDLLSDKRAGIMQKIEEAVNRDATSETAEQFKSYEDAKQVLDDEDATDDDSKARRQRQGLGIEVVDVRIMRADLPPDVSQSTFERMRKNFTKEAQKFRAEGEEKALEIRSGADRERVELLAQARKTSETLRGEGDGTASKIYADAFNKDKKFFEFYRTMQAYKKTMGRNDTTMILSPDSQFLKEFK